MIKNILKFGKVRLIYIVGRDKDYVSKTIFSLISDYYKVKRLEEFPKGIGRLKLIFKDIVIIEDKNFSPKEVKKGFSEFFRPIILFNPDNFSKEKRVLKLIPKEGTLLVDFKEKDKFKKPLHYITFGFNREADFYISNLNNEEELNFKLNYKGSSIPVWMDGGERKDALLLTGALAVGALLNLNLVEILKKDL